MAERKEFVLTGDSRYVSNMIWQRVLNLLKLATIIM